jgi:hypothetical protein
MPRSFRIRQLSEETSSWVSSIVATPPISSTDATVTHTTKEIERHVGFALHKQSASATILTSKTSPPISDSTSAKLSSKLYGTDGSNTIHNASLAEGVSDSLRRQLYKLPLGSWLRHSGALDDAAHFISQTTPTASILTSARHSVLGKSWIPHQSEMRP